MTVLRTIEEYQALLYAALDAVKPAGGEELRLWNGVRRRVQRFREGIPLGVPEARYDVTYSDGRVENALDFMSMEQGLQSDPGAVFTVCS